MFTAAMSPVLLAVVAVSGLACKRTMDELGLGSGKPPATRFGAD